MKRHFYIFLLLLLLYPLLPCMAEDLTDDEPESSWQFKHPVFFTGVNYDLNLVDGSSGAIEMAVDYAPVRWLGLSGGFRISSSALYQASTRGDFRWNVNGSHALGFTNRYFYSVYGSNKFQDFNAVLAFLYDYDFFHLALGGYFQFFTGFNIPSHSRSYIYEPGIVYDLEARIFKKEHIWNLGLQITNMRRFLIERMYSPNFIFKGNYRFGGYGSDNLNLMLEAGFQPAGLMHIVVNHYSFYFNIGLSWVI